MWEPVPFLHKYKHTSPSLSCGTSPDTGMTIKLSSPPFLVRRVDPFPDHKILCLFLCSGTSWKAYPAKIKGNVYYQFSHLTGSLGEQDLAEVLQKQVGLSFLAAVSYCISSAVTTNFSFNLAKDCSHKIYQMSVIYLRFMRNSFLTVYQMSYRCLKMLQVIIPLFTRSSKQSSHKQGLERRDLFRTGCLFYWYTHTDTGPECPH